MRFCIYAPTPHTAARIRSAERLGAMRDVSPLYEPFDTFEAAVARALNAKDAGEPVALVCRLSDIQRPQVEQAVFSAAEWRGACLAYLDTHGIELLKLKDPVSPSPAAVRIEDVVKSIQIASNTLTERVRVARLNQRRLVRAAERGYVSGRPPYGYRAIDGDFAVFKPQAAAVRFIFDQIRMGRPMASLVKDVRSRFQGHGYIAGQRQFWDRVKIRRILSRARLYCLGEYLCQGSTTPVHLPHLAFLPPAWASTTASPTKDPS
jgi:hypothetical protein